MKGIEPSQPAWKAGALPLSYTRMIFGILQTVDLASTIYDMSFKDKTFLVGMSGFEPLKAKLTDLQSVPFGQLWNIPKYMYLNNLFCTTKGLYWS